jgi:hypothetical protein
MTPHLDLGKVIAGAFLVPWWRRRAFTRALAAPCALIVAYSVVCYYSTDYVMSGFPQAAMWLVWVLYYLLFTLFAVKCHRLVLLDADAVAQRWRPGWSWRETRFFLWSAAIWGLGLAASWLLLLVAVNVWTWVAGISSDALRLTVHLWKIPVLYVFGRLCMLLPAAALDRRASLKWSWNLTRGNGWRLLVVVGGLPFVLSVLVGLIYRNDATTAEWLLLTLLAVALFAVEIAAISLSYRELTRDEDPLSSTATT